MNQLRKLRKNKEKNKRTITKVKSIYLKICLLLLNLIFATFAWFAYTRILVTDFNVDISTWKVDFKDNTGVLGNVMQIEVPNFYPGMTDYTKTVEISNLGEKDASITYSELTLKLLNTEYETTPDVATEDGKTTVKLLNDSTTYPFEVILKYDTVIKAITPTNTDNKGEVEIIVTWPYTVMEEDVESQTKNELDTLWGYNIAQFYNSPESEYSEALELTLNLNAQQIIN